MRPLNVDIVAGARPNFMKAGPVYRELSELESVVPRFIMTSQHTSIFMSDWHYKAVGLPDPVVVLPNSNNEYGVRNTSRMIALYDMEIQKNPPDWTVVFGDTDSSLAGAFVAKRNGVRVAHVEALVFGEIDTPEEHNRRMIDCISDLLLTPYLTCSIDKRLIRGKRVRVGNVMIDSLVSILNSKEYSELMKVPCDILVTMHRPSNVDNPRKLKRWLEVLDKLASEAQVLMPLHPRTSKMMSTHGIAIRHYMTTPMEYSEFIKCMSDCSLVITDSGGVGPEAVYLGKPVIALREQSGWFHLVDSEDMKLCSTPEDLANCVDRMRGREVQNSRFWEGNAAEGIGYAIRNFG